MVLELHASGDGGHSANAMATGAKNAIRELARDLVTLETLDLGEPHPLLGPNSAEPTIVEGGIAKNKVPEAAICVLDVRNVPGLSPREIVARPRGGARLRGSGPLRSAGPPGLRSRRRDRAGGARGAAGGGTLRIAHHE